jgi:HAD superfamily hydrolase (TIGR01458 family)
MNYLIDVNGVLYSGEKVVEGAVETVDFLRERKNNFRFISNATQRCKKSLLEKLSGFGFHINEKEIFTAPDAAIKYIKNSGKKRIFLLTTGDVHNDFLKEGFVIDEKDVDFVVVGDAGKDFTFENMNKAFRAILDGAGIIAMEKDRYWLSDDSKLTLTAGPFVSALEYASNKSAILVGKPGRDFFNLALNDMNAKPDRTYIVGDDIFTDILGGKKAGMKTILVETGEYTEGVLKSSKIKPDIIIKSIAKLQGMENFCRACLDYKFL